MDIPLIPNSQGLYRCLQCDYQSVNREHYKMHVVIHRPPKWKCFYCEQKYPVIFRLRRHSNQKHPNLPIRWVDIETGQTCVDPLKPSTASSTTNRRRTTTAGGAIIRETARKSTSKGALLQVAMFRSRNRRSRSQSDSDATIVDRTPFIIGEPYSLVSSSDSEVESQVVVTMCCHLCEFETCERVDFSRHLETSHVELNDSVVVEVLPRGGDGDCGEVLALRRCGFCAFETYVVEEFETHVRTHTSGLPFRCEYCCHASFNREKVEEHVVDCHPGSEVRVRPLTNEAYTMTTGFSGHYWSVNLDAFVELEDVMKIADEEFESVLGSHGVTYEGCDRCVDDG